MSRKSLIEEIESGFHVIKNRLHAQMIASRAKSGITPSQLFVLAIIGRHRDIGLRKISERLCVSPSAATQLVDSLVDNGYVLRRTDADDRRVREIELSRKGHRHLTELKNRRLKAITTLFAALTDQELSTYLQLHRKILSGITR